MTAPNQEEPTYVDYVGGDGGIAAWASKSDQQWKDAATEGVEASFNPLGTFFGNIPIIGDIMEWFEGVGDQVNSATIWLNDSLGRSAALASRVASLEGKIATGAQVFDDFNRGETGNSLGNNWIEFGAGQTLRIEDQAAQLYRFSLPTAGIRAALRPEPASADDFSVLGVVHPRGTPNNPATMLIARSNADGTQGLCVRFWGNRTALCRFTRSGNSWNFTVIKSTTAFYYSNSATVEFKGSGTQLQVIIDRRLILSEVDATHTISSAFRYAGFAEETWTGILAFPQYSAGLASFALKSQASLDNVNTTATNAANAVVAPVTAAVNAGSVGAAIPVGADPNVYAATKSLSDAATLAINQSTNTAIIVQRQQQNENVGSGGLNKLMTFGNGPLNNNPEWSSGTAFVMSNGQMALSGSAGPAFYLARVNYSFTTDSQAVTAQLGANANNDQATYLILRADPTGAQGTALRITANSLALGTISFPGDGSGSPGFSTALSVSRGQSSGDSIEFRAVGNSYTVMVNGTTVGGLAFTGNLGNIGSGWRSAGVVMQKASPFITYYSFNLSSFGMYDFGTVGSSVNSRTAVKVSRASTGTINVTVGNGGNANFPSGFWSAVDFAQGITLQDLTVGSVLITTPDWYEVTASFGTVYNTDSGGNYWGPAFWCLIVNGTVVAPVIPAGVPLKWAFAANDVVQVGISNVGSSVMGRGVNSDSAYASTGPANVVQIGGGFRAFYQIVAVPNA